MNKYYLGKRNYAILDWDGKEESQITANWRYNCAKHNIGCVIGQFKDKQAFWDAMRNEDEIKDFLEKRHIDSLEGFYLAKIAQREAEQARMAKRNEALKEQRIQSYEALKEQACPIPTTYENIGIVLRYLNTSNCGGWKLPAMTIGYSCNQYDCDGKQASTMTLDNPIEIDGEMVDKFVVGAPLGHLTKYHRV